MGFYFGPNGSIDALSDFGYCNLWSDVVFGYGIDRAVRRQANASTANTFFYRYVGPLLVCSIFLRIFHNFFYKIYLFILNLIEFLYIVFSLN